MNEQSSESVFYYSDSDSDNEEGADYYQIIDSVEGWDKDYKNKQYYLGFPYYDDEFYTYILASSIKNTTLFQFPFINCYKYLYYNSVILNSPHPNIEIMKLELEEDACELDMLYQVVLKTHWIRLIQRTWKKIYALRKKYKIKKFALKGMLKNLVKSQ